MIWNFCGRRGAQHNVEAPNIIIALAPHESNITIGARYLGAAACGGTDARKSGPLRWCLRGGSTGPTFASSGVAERSANLASFSGESLPPSDGLNEATPAARGEATADARCAEIFTTSWKSLGAIAEAVPRNCLYSFRSPRLEGAARKLHDQNPDNSADLPGAAGGKSRVRFSYCSEPAIAARGDGLPEPRTPHREYPETREPAPSRPTTAMRGTECASHP
jgi:hypothetical protein